MPQKMLWSAITILTSIVGYFICGLLSQIDTTSRDVAAIHEKVAVLESEVDDLKLFKMEIKNERKRMANDAELKVLVKAISDVELLGSEVMGGVSLSELSQLIAIAADLPLVVQDANVMIPEFSALDDAARADLVAYVQANCKFPANVSIEAWVQKILSAAIVLSSLFAQPAVQK